MTPAEQRAASHRTGLKVHLRVVDVGATTYRVVSLRPATGVRFSTNYFHDTWHILAGCDGAAVLARLLWGLSFQRQPGTVVVVDGEHLVPTPFEADPPDPILLASAGLASMAVDHLRALRHRLRGMAPTRTLRWHTFGMPVGREANDQLNRRDPGLWRARYCGDHPREHMDRRAGFVCFTAPPDALRADALGIDNMSETRIMSYHPLASGGRWSWNPEGEVQVFSELTARVVAARQARRGVIGEVDRALTDGERDAVYARTDAIARRRRAATRKAP